MSLAFNTDGRRELKVCLDEHMVAYLQIHHTFVAQNKFTIRYGIDNPTFYDMQVKTLYMSEYLFTVNHIVNIRGAVFSQFNDKQKDALINQDLELFISAFNELRECSRHYQLSDDNKEPSENIVNKYRYQIIDMLMITLNDASWLSKVELVKVIDDQLSKITLTTEPIAKLFCRCCQYRCRIIDALMAPGDLLIVKIMDDQLDRHLINERKGLHNVICYS